MLYVFHCVFILSGLLHFKIWINIYFSNIQKGLIFFLLPIIKKYISETHLLFSSLQFYLWTHFRKKTFFFFSISWHNLTWGSSSSQSQTRGKHCFGERICLLKLKQYQKLWKLEKLSQNSIFLAFWSRL